MVFFDVRASVCYKESIKCSRGRGLLPWLQILALSLSPSLSLSFPFCLCLCLSFRLLVLSVGVGMHSLVYELDPVALRCRESERRDGVVFKSSRLLCGDGQFLAQSINNNVFFIHHSPGSLSIRVQPVYSAQCVFFLQLCWHISSF